MCPALTAGATFPFNNLYNHRMLQVNQLTCEREQRVLFENVSFSVQSGELLRVEGGNGTGKTTLLRILCGLYEDHEGEVTWETAQYPLYVGHKPGVKDQLTAFENLTWLCQLSGRSHSHQALMEALERVNLRGFEGVPCGSMSEGQRKRVNLARLFLPLPDALILDEPFSAIDVAGVEWLENRMREHLGNGGVIILTSHQTVNLDARVRTLSLGVRS